MKLTHQVINVELAKELKKLGVTDPSQLCWRRWIPVKGSTYHEPEWKISIFKGSVDEDEILPAYTVAELGEMLPANCSSFKVTGGANGMKFIEWGGRIYHNGESRVRFSAFTEADVRARMLIFILEEEKRYYVD